MNSIINFFKYIVLFWSYQILTAWGLSIFSLYSTRAVGIATVIFLAGSVFFLLKNTDYLKKRLNNIRLRFTRHSRRNRFAILSVLILWTLFLIFNLVFILGSPTINWDSLTYHLPKVANAAQTGSLWYDSTISVNRVNIFGSNSSILNGVAFSVLGIDYLIEVPQLLSAVLIPLALFYIGVAIFKKSKLSSLIATISVLTIPLYLYEANTTQNDLTFTLILLISVIFLYKLYNTFNLSNLLFTAFAVAILVGTKHHGIIAGGIIGLLILVRLVKAYRNSELFSLRGWLQIALALPLLILIAIPNNIIGLLYYGSFIALDPGDAKKVTIGPATIWNNIKHFGAWFYLRDMSEPKYFSHDVGHAGILNMFALPLYLYIGIKTFINKHFNRIIFFLIIWGTLLILFIIRNPDQWDLRLILFLPITGVFVASVYLLDRFNGKSRVFITLIIVALVLVNVGITFIKVQYPVLKLSARSILDKSEPMDIGEYYLPRYMEHVHGYESHRQGNSSTVIVVGSNDFPLYPYYGERWENSVVYYGMDDMQLEILDSVSWDYLVIFHNSDDARRSMYAEVSNEYTKVSKDVYADVFLNSENE